MSQRLDEIVHALEAQGLTDIKAHPAFMIVNGRIAPGHLDVLRTVAGVKAVREDGKYTAIDGAGEAS